jgi:hypothetical protein
MTFNDFQSDDFDIYHKTMLLSLLLFGVFELKSAYETIKVQVSSEKGQIQNEHSRSTTQEHTGGANCREFFNCVKRFKKLPSEESI